MISNTRPTHAHNSVVLKNKNGCLAAILSSTAIALVMSAAPVSVQAAEPAATAQAAQPEEIVVTGSRIIREGYDAPVPLTVVGIEALQTSATSNIADYVATMPAFSGGNSPASTSTGLTAGTSGVNQLNLRQLGIIRTLILLDGQRSVGSTFDNAVDINTFPQALISRVDVVTGGASAVYGSDAVAGVANFILDKEYVGTKGELSGGVTTYGDDADYKFSLTHGLVFGGGRGHFLASGEIVKKDGIPGAASREWALTGTTIMANPNYTATNGQPNQLILNHVGYVNAAPG
ncbi:MAG: TonB-dependent receptor plug domain-containing protein, partial [Rhodospirillaceae bacterium]